MPHDSIATFMVTPAAGVESVKEQWGTSELGAEMELNVVELDALEFTARPSS